MATTSGVSGNRSKEPWHFITTNVREMIAESLDTALKASLGAPGVYERELLVAINNLHHAAAELERSRLELIYGLKERQ